MRVRNECSKNSIDTKVWNMCFIYCCTHHKNTDEKKNPNANSYAINFDITTERRTDINSIISIFNMAKMHEMLNGLECPCGIKKIKQW